MVIHFHEPPPAQKAGGLDAAISSLGAALESAGHQVALNPPRGIRPHVVHFHGLWQPAFPTIARNCVKDGVPFVVSPHGMLEPWAIRHKRWKKLPYWHLVEKRWVNRAACILATADTEASRLRRFLPANRISALPLGLTGSARPDYSAARTALGWGGDETVLLFLSRIHEKKGLDLLLGALADLHGTIPPRTRLIIVGPEEQPGYAAKCRAFAENNAALLPRVEWHGAVWGGKRWPLLQGADLFCLPTHSENFGLVVLEACQVGTPALTTTETPWAGPLGGGRGFICEPLRASVRSALVSFFQAGHRSPADRDALSAWAVGEYDWSLLAPRYAELYASL